MVGRRFPQTLAPKMRTMIPAVIAALLYLQTAEGAVGVQWPPAGTAEVRAFTFAGGPSDLIIKNHLKLDL